MEEQIEEIIKETNTVDTTGRLRPMLIEIYKLGQNDFRKKAEENMPNKEWFDQEWENCKARNKCTAFLIFNSFRNQALAAIREL